MDKTIRLQPKIKRYLDNQIKLKRKRDSFAPSLKRVLEKIVEDHYKSIQL